jgi:aldehyde dehydrogenase (NAD+)
MNASITEHLRRAGRLDRAFIDGEWVRPQGTDRAVVIDPSTEQAIAEIALGNTRCSAASTP